MLFATTPPDRQGARVRLYFCPEDARVAHQDRRAIYRVAVHYDGHLGRLTTLANLYRGSDPGWTAPAEHHRDGCLVVRGPLPASLFAEVVAGVN